MQRLITHSCGHDQSHDINGHFAADPDRQANRLARQKCRSCYDAANAVRAAKDSEAIADLTLVPLTGSEKQVVWAETLRTKRIAAVRKRSPTAADRLASIADAKWWIDNRLVPDATFLVSALPPGPIA
ncbi:hypothetical protein [Sphingomonas sp. TX0522]|uniref:hypothetical protein n=1 Tax=Sphingomonas sp. TX0522 TaxID=2479205 RepID=UPI0018E0182E|nr:hypothetical protein [Sphingomonas sp. TX0522]MBI0533016.1 hypothetical protein [Sphingomonas sp. TX0522]